MSLTVTDVVSQFGAYYKPGSDNEKNMRNMIYKPSETALLFQVRPTEDTIWRGTLASMSRVIQPFQKAFTALGSMTWEPNKFDLYNIKIDVEEIPDELESTYLGFLTSVDEADRAKWPFVKWWIENHIMMKKDEDLETAEYFDGVYAAPTPGTPGAAGTSMNGLKKVIVDYNSSGRTNFGNGAISTGAPASSDADWCTQVEEFVAAIPSQVRKKIDVVAMSLDLELKYKRGKRSKYGKDVNFLDQASVAGLASIEDYPNVKVKGLESHAESDLIWASIPINRIRPIKKASQKDQMKVESAKRVVSAFTNWWEALNFEVPEFLFHNDQLS